MYKSVILNFSKTFAGMNSACLEQASRKYIQKSASSYLTSQFSLPSKQANGKCIVFRLEFLKQCHIFSFIRVCTK